MNAFQKNVDGQFLISKRKSIDSNSLKNDLNPSRSNPKTRATQTLSTLKDPRSTKPLEPLQTILKSHPKWNLKSHPKWNQSILWNPAMSRSSVEIEMSIDSGKPSDVTMFKSGTTFSSNWQKPAMRGYRSEGDGLNSKRQSGSGSHQKSLHSNLGHFEAE
jgi:hypothetical protein